MREKGIAGTTAEAEVDGDDLPGSSVQERVGSGQWGRVWAGGGKNWELGKPEKALASVRKAHRSE